MVSANSIEAESWSNHRKDSSFMLHRIGRLERFSFRRAKSSSIAVLYRKECRGRRLEKKRGLGQYGKNIYRWKGKNIYIDGMVWQNCRVPNLVSKRNRNIVITHMEALVFILKGADSG